MFVANWRHSTAQQADLRLILNCSCDAPSGIIEGVEIFSDRPARPGHFLASSAYVAGSPFVYIGYYHVPPQSFGLLFGSGIVGMMAVNLIGGRLVMRWGERTSTARGTAIAAIAALVLAIETWSDWGELANVAVPSSC